MLKPSPLVDQAVAYLRGEIESGRWPVGSKLPGETTLARTLGVGRTTVREALSALAGAGMVRARQGAGVFVLADRPADDWLQRAAVADVYEVRMMLEVQAAGLAAQRRTPADVAALRDALAARRDAADRDDAAFVDADVALHGAVVTAAGNPALTALFGEFTPVLRGALVDLVALLGLRTTDRTPGDTSHAALVDAIERGDAAAATAVLQDELGRTLEHLRA
ncbi:FadR/GntR family transcriptional regulator [Cryptosporangium sp. NPDC048952]|uniref:FadR/GntR family transcriptional regulator n=1 Tax=Cryptosporangium sp. NPDC048952 TaxID=3363961 RepID=UPI003715A180